MDLEDLEFDIREIIWDEDVYISNKDDDYYSFRTEDWVTELTQKIIDIVRKELGEPPVSNEILPDVVFSDKGAELVNVNTYEIYLKAINAQNHNEFTDWFIEEFDN